MHARGWRSVYCMPKRPAFKGSAPINLSDRLNQVLRWALGSVEILLSRHCPIWYGYGGRLKWLERFAYVNTTIYPVTAIPLLMYCTLPAVCLLTNKFIIPQVCHFFMNKIHYIACSCQCCVVPDINVLRTECLSKLCSKNSEWIHLWENHSLGYASEHTSYLSYMINVMS